MEAGAPPGARHWRPSSRTSSRAPSYGAPVVGSLAAEPPAGTSGSCAAPTFNTLHAALVQKLQPLAHSACAGGPLASACGVEPGSRDSSRSDLSAEARQAGWWLGEGPDSPAGASDVALRSGGFMPGSLGLSSSSVSSRPAAPDAFGTPRTPNGHLSRAAAGADSVTPPGLPPGEALVTPPRPGMAPSARGVRRQLVQSFSDDDHLGVFDVPTSPGDSPARPSPPGASGAWAWPAGTGDGGCTAESPVRSSGSPGSNATSPPSGSGSCAGRSEYATPGKRGALTPGRGSGASWRPPRPPSSAALRAFHGSKASLLAAAAAHKTPTSVLDQQPSPPHSGASSEGAGGTLHDVALATPPRKHAAAPVIAAAAPHDAAMVVLRPRRATASRGCSVLSSLGLACGVRTRASPPQRSPPQPAPKVAPLPQTQYVIRPVPLTASPAPRRWGAPGWGEDDAVATAQATAAAAAARDGATPPGARRPLAPRQLPHAPQPRSDKPPRTRMCSVFG